MKTRNDDYGVIFDMKEQTVGKFTQKCSMHILKRDRKLVWILLHPENRGS